MKWIACTPSVTLVWRYFGTATAKHCVVDQNLPICKIDGCLTRTRKD